MGVRGVRMVGSGVGVVGVRGWGSRDFQHRTCSAL